jgi:DNA-binding beta-propeller fold protein YncE
MKTRIGTRAVLLVAAMMIVAVASTYIRADTGTCGGASITLPFTDVSGSNVFFCEIAEAYFSGLTSGTSSTTYSPGDNVTREQMAAFVTRTMDQSLQRGSRRAALKRFWTPTTAGGLALTTVGSNPQLVESDGADLWVANYVDTAVSRVRASDGKLLETWFGAGAAVGVLAAKGLIFVTGNTVPGNLYQIDPTQPAGSVTWLPISLGDFPNGIAFDGSRIWTANGGQGGGSVSIVTLNPLGVTTVTTGFAGLRGILYDGANMWVTDRDTIPGKLYKLDSNGVIIQTVTVGDLPEFPVFDGTNIWVPNGNSNTVTVVRASTGAVITTLTGNGMLFPFAAAFDGERILVTNINGPTVSLWKAADLSPLGFVDTGATPIGACSDGLNFWITLGGANKLARF